MRYNLKVDPVGKASADRERDAKINERSVAKSMPLLIEFPIYFGWEIEAQRWPMLLYNRPVSLGIDYFVNKLKGSKTSRVDVEAGGVLKHKLKSKIDENEEAIKKGGDYEPTNYVWAFNILRTKFQEPDGAPVIRIMQQLGEREVIIYRELRIWARNQEGVWDWSGWRVGEETLIDRADI